MVGGSSWYSSSGTRVRVPVMAAGLVAAGIFAAACGTSGPPGAASGASRSPAVAPSGAAGAAGSAGSCARVPGVHHARLVVEPAAGRVVARCVGFSGKDMAALKLLEESHLELGTQTFSFGVAICQVDDVPAHYTQCLASGQDYWALFLSTNGRTWTSPSVGVSDVTVPPGGSLGLRYDPPNGSPAPPPPPTPA